MSRAVPGRRGPDHLSIQRKYIHVIIFDALMGGEDVADAPGTRAGDLVRGDGCLHAAAANRHSPFNLARGDGPGQGN